MAAVYQILAFFRRDWRLARSSPFGFVWQLGAVIFAAPTLYYVGRLIQPRTPSLAAYGGDYFTFAVLGIAFSGFLAAAMAVCAAAVRQEQVGGTLDALLTVPASLSTMALGASLWPMLQSAAQSLLYVGLGVVMFRIDLSHANLPAAGAIVVLSTIVSAALGLFAVAFVLLLRRTEPLTGIAAGVGALLGGVFYPVAILPPRAQIVAQFIPLTPALHGLRLSLMRGADLPAIAPSIVVLLGWCILLVPLSCACAHAALTEAKRSGIAGGYG